MQRIMLWGCVVVMTGLMGGCGGKLNDGLPEAIRRYESLAEPRMLARSEGQGRSDVRSDTVEDLPEWFTFGRLVAQRDETPKAPKKPTAGKKGYVPWRERRGPAYPGNVWRTIGRDAKELPFTLLDDAKATVTNPLSLVGLTLAGVSGIVVNASGADNRVQDHYEPRGSQLNTFWDNVGDVGGNPGSHFAVAGAMYLTSLMRNDTKNYEVSKTLINALALNGLYTLGLKGIVRTRSPNDDPFGWPSGHTSSTFCFATVLHEYYGPWVGIPLFAFATYVGYERIDARNHDFSDVISGALIGIAVGHAVCKNHEIKILGMSVLPYVDPATNSTGVMLVKQW